MSARGVASRRAWSGGLGECGTYRVSVQHEERHRRGPLEHLPLRKEDAGEVEGERGSLGDHLDENQADVGGDIGHGAIG